MTVESRISFLRRAIIAFGLEGNASRADWESSDPTIKFLEKTEVPCELLPGQSLVRFNGKLVGSAFEEPGTEVIAQVVAWTPEEAVAKMGCTITEACSQGVIRANTFFGFKINCGQGWQLVGAEDQRNGKRRDEVFDITLRNIKFSLLRVL